jgi:hypothetical protein
MPITTIDISIAIAVYSSEMFCVFYPISLIFKTGKQTNFTKQCRKKSRIND